MKNWQSKYLWGQILLTNLKTHFIVIFAWHCEFFINAINKCTQKLLEIWLKIEKYQFYDLCFFDVVVKKIHQFFQNRKIDNFMFLTISLVFFQIKRCSKWHFNPLNNSFLPLEEKFTPGLIFFELLKAPKNTLLWPFQVNFNGIWTAIWTL